MDGIYCYCHVDGEILIVNGTIEYRGGCTIGMDVPYGTTFAKFKEMLNEAFECDLFNRPIQYTVRFNQTKLIDLFSDRGMADLLKNNKDCGMVYILANLSSGGSNGVIPSISSSPGLACIQACQHSHSLPSSCMGALASSSSMPTFASMQYAAVITGKGQVFENAEELRVALYMFSLAHGFDYKFLRNAPRRIHVQCKAEGCHWVLIASGIHNVDMLIVRTYEGNHSHSAQDVINVHHRRSAKLLASIVKNKFSRMPDTTPNALRGEFLSEHGINLTYKQAWRCKERSIAELHGDAAESYMLIPWFCQRLQQTDPSTMAIWECSKDRRFERLFVAYGSSLRGFQNGCRPLLFIDGCHLTGPYRGTLLSANAIDANNDLYPFAYAAVSGETLNEWTWFLLKVKEAVGAIDITIISDRHEAIKGAVGAVFGHSCHAFCYRHIKEDFSSQVRKHCRCIKRAKDDALYILDQVAYARVDYKYNHAMENLRRFSPKLASWVENNSDVEKWALSKFPRMRWEKITTNIAESYNAWVVKERGHNLFQFMKEHHEKLAMKLVRCKKDMLNWENGVGPKVEKRLLLNVRLCAGMNAQQYGPHVYRIQTKIHDSTVDVSLRVCSCKEWQLCGIPCSHACAAIKAAKGNVYTFVGECYSQAVQARIYEHTMLPVDTANSPDLEHKPPEISTSYEFIQPPLTSNPPGRPLKKRKESQFSNKQQYYCSRCFRSGHNRSTCKNPNPHNGDKQV